MQLIHRTAELRDRLAMAPRPAFVPTMGNLHDGHIDLVRQARAAGGPVVASIFVNPLQFGAGEDYSRYPRTLAQDCEKLEAAGCDIVFAPDVAEMYPEPQAFRVVPPLAGELCGAFRPGHFEGVCTVVLKLFNLVQPRLAIFGKKDYQQLFLLKAMTRQLNLPIEIGEGETTRAADGLALSSRNGYLSAEQRAEAPRLYRTLRNMAEALSAGRGKPDELANAARDTLHRHGWRVDYISVRSQSTLLPPETDETRLVILAAAHLGNTRLIDNVEVSVGAV